MVATEVFFIADDFGMNHEINDAVIHAHGSGSLHGASLMMGQEATDGAVELARQHPSLLTGFHFHVCDSVPLTCPRWPWGRSPARAGLALGVSAAARRLVRAELEAQWRAYEATGLPCAFANTHHHLHIHPFLLGTFLDTVRVGEGGFVRLGPAWSMRTRRPFPLVGRIVRALEAWGRGGRPRPAVLDGIWGIDRTFRMDAGEVRGVVAALPPGRHEFIFHPRNRTQDADTRCLLGLKS